ncbi:hypothetical protein D9X30_4868 [Cupriavidus sp. U2]|nr:hypothetical protein D9X30_4868 [Cupriavidus sp. U2]
MPAYRRVHAARTSRSPARPTRCSIGVTSEPAGLWTGMAKALRRMSSIFTVRSSCNVKGSIARQGHQRLSTPSREGASWTAHRGHRSCWPAAAIQWGILGFFPGMRHGVGDKKPLLFLETPNNESRIRASCAPGSVWRPNRVRGDVHALDRPGRHGGATVQGGTSHRAKPEWLHGIRNRHKKNGVNVWVDAVPNSAIGIALMRRRCTDRVAR